MSGRRVASVERRAIDPNAVEDHSDLARNGDLCLFHTDPLRDSPGLEGTPFLGPIEKDGRCLKQGRFGEVNRPIEISCH